MLCLIGVLVWRGGVFLLILLGVLGLEQSLSDLGWFDPNRRHRPVTLLPEPVEDDVHVEPNLVAVSVDEISPEYVELYMQYLKGGLYGTLYIMFKSC